MCMLLRNCFILFFFFLSFGSRFSRVGVEIFISSEIMMLSSLFEKCFFFFFSNTIFSMRSIKLNCNCYWGKE